jgi:hypothetical protein
MPLHPRLSLFIQPPYKVNIADRRLAHNTNEQRPFRNLLSIASRTRTNDFSLYPPAVSLNASESLFLLCTRHSFGMALELPLFKRDAFESTVPRRPIRLPVLLLVKVPPRLTVSTRLGSIKVTGTVHCASTAFILTLVCVNPFLATAKFMMSACYFVRCTNSINGFLKEHSLGDPNLPPPSFLLSIFHERSVIKTGRWSLCPLTTDNKEGWHSHWGSVELAWHSSEEQLVLVLLIFEVRTGFPHRSSGGKATSTVDATAFT